MNAALRAKLEFIKSKYDFTTNVNVLNSDDFKTLMTSNDMVSFIINRRRMQTNALLAIKTLTILIFTTRAIGKHNDEGLCGKVGSYQDGDPEVRNAPLQRLIKIMIMKKKMIDHSFYKPSVPYIDIHIFSYI